LSSLSEMFFTSFFVAGVAILLLNSIRAHSFDIHNKPTNLWWTVCEVPEYYDTSWFGEYCHVLFAHCYHDQ